MPTTNNLLECVYVLCIPCTIKISSSSSKAKAGFCLFTHIPLFSLSLVHWLSIREEEKVIRHILRPNRKYVRQRKKERIVKTLKEEKNDVRHSSNIDSKTYWYDVNIKYVIGEVNICFGKMFWLGSILTEIMQEKNT